MFTKLYFLVISFIFLAMPVISEAHYNLVEIQESRAEINLSISTADFTNIADMVVIYQLEMNLEGGDIITASAQTEITNPTSQGRFGIGKGIVISKDPDSPVDIWVNPPTMSNVSPEERHEVLNLSGDYKVKESGVYYISLVGYAVNLTIGGTHVLKVQPGYGFLNVKVLRPVLWPNGPYAPIIQNPHYEVSDIQETSEIKNGQVQVSPSLSTAEKVVIYQLDLNLAAGDIIDATAQTELTSSRWKSYGLGRGIAVSKNRDNPIEEWVNPPTFSNVTLVEHHAVYSMSGDYTVLEDGLYTISLIVYSTGYQVTERDYLKVEPGYGFLNVKVYRKVD